MLTVTGLRVLGMVLLSLSGAAHAQAPGVRPIEHYVSPPQLFPQEDVARAPYAPLPVYDRPHGKVVGRIVRVDPCPASGDVSPPSCYEWTMWRLEPAAGGSIELPHEMVAYDQEAIVSYRPAMVEKGVAWSHVEYEGGAFWLRGPVADVSVYEALASSIGDFDTWCTRPGECGPVSAAMRAEIDRVLARDDALAQRTYSIKRVVGRGARRYYEVSLPEFDLDYAKPNLPAHGYIPTRRKDGAHIGEFFPKGC